MVRSLCAALALASVPAAATPSLLGPADVTHGLHLVAQAPPTAGLPPNATRAQISAQLVRVQQELDALPGRGGPMAMTIAGFASAAAGAATFPFAGVVALFGSSVAAAIAIVGLVVCGAGIVVGIIGAVLLGSVGAARQEPEARLTAERTYLEGLLKLSDSAPPPPAGPPPDVQWLARPRPLVLASF